MQNVATKSRVTVIVAAIMAVVVAAAVGSAAFATPAYAVSYMPGTHVENAKTIPQKKSKIAGTWKLLKSSMASTNQIIKHNKSISSKAKCTISFKKNGSMILKDFDGSVNKSYRWVAISKKGGYLVYQGMLIAPIKVKGKQLKLTFPETDTTKGFTWTMGKM